MAEKKAIKTETIQQKNEVPSLNRFGKVKIWFDGLHKTTKIFLGVAGLAVVIFLAARILRPSAASVSTYQTSVFQRGDLIAIVGATGNVEANQSAALTWQTNGRVENIYFKINDQVRMGDVLADLALNSVAQNIAIAQADLVNAKRALEDVLTSDTARSKAYSDLLEAEKDLEKSRDDRDRWNYNNADEARIEQARTEFIRAEDAFQKTTIENAVALELAIDDPKRVEAQKAVEEARLARDKALRAVSYLLGKSYTQDVADDFAAYDLALARVEDARREWERLKETPNVEDVSAAEARVAAAEATLNLSRIVAPMSGRVTVAEPKVGDMVKSGQTAFQVDDLSALFIDVNIPEVDINRIIVGQPVEISFDAILGQTYKGIVIEAGKAGSLVDGAINFKVKVRLIEPDEQIKTGMTAAVNIIVNKLENVFTVPNRAVRLKDGQRVVYVLRDGKLVAVQVTIGASSDILTEITNAQIEEGEVIVLNPPLDLTSTNGGFQPPFMR